MTEVLHSVFVEFAVPMKLVRLIKICLNETYSKVHIGENLPDILIPKMVYETWRYFTHTALELYFRTMLFNIFLII
jgi:hypothetical protein